MHISSVAALGPDTTVLFWLSPVLLYVHAQVILPVVNVVNAGALNSATVGCSQSSLDTIRLVPSRTSAWTVCLCECVDINQIFPDGVGHVIVSTSPTAWGG